MTSPVGYRFFHVVAMIFVASLLISNTIAIKIISVGGFVLPAGIIVFPISYIFSDVMVELYGFNKTRSVIWWGFICLAGMSLLYYIAASLPPAPFWQHQQSFVQFFGFVPRIALSSFIAYLVGEFLNSIIMSRLKVRTEGRYFGLRAVLSTIVGQGADSLVFNFTAFTGVFPIKDVAFIALSGFILKSLYEVLVLPLTYFIVGWLKKVEGIDTYDRDISYNPFKIE
jgi:queuosine precursor transporter